MLVGALVVWWWWRPAAPPPRVVAELDAAAAPATSSTERPTLDDAPLAGSGADPRERRAASLDAPYIDPPTVQARMTDAHAHLQDVAKTCLSPTTRKFGANDQFRFAYTLTYAQGQARISNVEIVWSELGDGVVEQCLLDKIGALTWTVADADWSTTAEDSLVGPDLE